MWLADKKLEDILDEILEDDSNCVVCAQTERGIRTAAQLLVWMLASLFFRLFVHSILEIEMKNKLRGRRADVTGHPNRCAAVGMDAGFAFFVFFLFVAFWKLKWKKDELLQADVDVDSVIQRILNTGAQEVQKPRKKKDSKETGCRGTAHLLHFDFCEALLLVRQIDFLIARFLDQC